MPLNKVNIKLENERVISAKLFNQYKGACIPCRMNGKEFDLGFWQMATILFQPRHPFFPLALEFEYLIESNKYAFSWYKEDSIIMDFEKYSQTKLEQAFKDMFLGENIPNCSLWQRVPLRNVQDAVSIATLAGKLLWKFYATKHGQKKNVIGNKVSVIDRIYPKAVSQKTLGEDFTWFHEECNVKMKIPNFFWTKTSLMNALNENRVEKRNLQKFTNKCEGWTAFLEEIQRRQKELQIRVKNDKEKFITFLNTKESKMSKEDSEIFTEAKKLLALQNDNNNDVPELLKNAPNSWKELFEQNFQVLHNNDLDQKMSVKQFEGLFKLLNGVTDLSEPTKTDLMNLRNDMGFRLGGHANEKLNVKRKSMHTPEQVYILKARRFAKNVANVFERRAQRYKELEAQFSAENVQHSIPENKQQVLNTMEFNIYWWDNMNYYLDSPNQLFSILYKIIANGVTDPLEHIEVEQLEAKLNQDAMNSIQTFITWITAPSYDKKTGKWIQTLIPEGSDKFKELVQLTFEEQPEDVFFLKSTFLSMIAGFAHHHVEIFKELKHFPAPEYPDYEVFPAAYELASMGNGVETDISNKSEELFHEV